MTTTWPKALEPTPGSLLGCALEFFLFMVSVRSWLSSFGVPAHVVRGSQQTESVELLDFVGRFGFAFVFLLLTLSGLRRRVAELYCSAAINV